MSSRSDDDPVKSSSTERYSRVASNLDWGYAMLGIFCIMVAMYLGLGLVLNSKLPIQIAYGLASLPFIFVFLRFFKQTH
jgi:hypothetical protein